MKLSDQIKGSLEGRLLNMNYHWKHERFLGFEFPEQYRLEVGENHLIEIKGNPFKGKTKIKITTPQGNCNESTISNGVVINEIDANTNRSKYLENFFASYSREISSLPDNTLLKLIGENYGVLTNFLDKHDINDDNKKSDLNILLRIPRKLFYILKDYFQIIFRRPQFSDVIDTFVIALIGFGAYYQNFSYFLSGISTAGAAMFTGYFDWLIRKRPPYLIKIIVASLIGGYLSYSGFFYQ